MISSCHLMMGGDMASWLSAQGAASDGTSDPWCVVCVRADEVKLVDQGVRWTMILCEKICVD